MASRPKRSTARRPDTPPPRTGSGEKEVLLAHMTEETGRHAGHADILRELIDGRTGR